MQPETAKYPVPTVLNGVILIVCTALYFFLLQRGTAAGNLWITALYGFLFGVVMIPVYSLIHEAEHGVLFPAEKWNTAAGRWLCALFVVSFSFFRHCHLRHHKKNRTDLEMWDLYYEHQNKWKRFGNLYGMMLGCGYLALWLSVILFSIYPKIVYTRFFQEHNEIGGFLEGGNQEQKLRAFQWESMGVILFQASLFAVFQWPFLPWLIMFLVHGLIWSSQNYVNHAFSPRDIINGAHNLNVPVWLKVIYLNFNMHLAHHQHPGIPWIHLPRFIRKGEKRISFFKNYLRLWKGPVLTQEAPAKEEPVQHPSLADFL
jgi:fatty acid desaturase